MAFTTSAAASVLQSHSSSTSQPGVGFSETAPLSSFNELNFTQNSRSQQFYFPNSSISTSNSHQTITLDLTRPSTSSYFNRLVAVPRYSSTCLNFSSSSPSSSSSYMPQASWKSIHNIASFSGANRQPPDKHFYQPYSAQMVLTQAPPPLTETIAAATKAITADPSFRSALVAAVTSLLGNGSTGARESHGGGEASSPNNGVGCLSGYSNGPLSQQEQGSLTLFPASLLVSTPNRGSGSAADSGDHIK